MLVNYMNKRVQIVGEKTLKKIIHEKQKKSLSKRMLGEFITNQSTI